MYLKELKKQIQEYERENNVRDNIGRRLWNTIKTLQGGSKKRKRGNTGSSSQHVSGSSSINAVPEPVIRYVHQQDPAYINMMHKLHDRYATIMGTYFGHPHFYPEDIYGLYLEHENGTVRGYKKEVRPFELFPNPNPQQIRAFYFGRQHKVPRYFQDGWTAHSVGLKDLCRQFPRKKLLIKFKKNKPNSGQ